MTGCHEPITGGLEAVTAAVRVMSASLWRRQITRWTDWTLPLTAGRIQRAGANYPATAVDLVSSADREAGGFGIWLRGGHWLRQLRCHYDSRTLWAIAQGGMPIPVKRQIGYLEENVGAAEITLTEAGLAELDEADPGGRRVRRPLSVRPNVNG